jgi:hypothetical protein
MGILGSQRLRLVLVAALGLLAVASVLLLATEAARADHPAVSEVVGTQEVAGEEVTVSRHPDAIGSLDPRASGEAQASAPTAASTIPATCPVVDRTADDTGNAAHPVTSPVIKVIYAYPTNVGNRLSTYAPVIQAGAQRVGDLVASESGGVESLRYDIGTAGGEGCLDIQRVALTQPASYYTAAPQSTIFSRIKTEVQALAGVQLGIRNYVVYADGIAPPGIAGEAQVRFDDSASGLFQNLGGLWAVMYGRGGTDFFGSGFSYPPGATSRNHVDYVLHEISHNLGAVQGSAPNRSAASHCLDEWDVLCYDDDGSGGLSTFLACGSPFSASNQAWDCNKNDYYNPNPASGSYLANRWNLTRSVFMCAVAACGPGGTPVIASEPDGSYGSSPRERPPDTRILAGPRGKRAGRTAKFRFEADSAGAGFECLLDRGHFEPCTSPSRYRHLRPGRHTFQVRATDAAGDDPTPAVRRFGVAPKARKPAR